MMAGNPRRNGDRLSGLRLAGLSLSFVSVETVGISQWTLFDHQFGPSDEARIDASGA
jgi:hypothetical protein